MSWQNLSVSQRARLMNIFRQNGVLDLSEMRRIYDEQNPSLTDETPGPFMSAPMYAKGGSIYIKPENRGKFNATKKRTGKTTEELTHSKNPITRKRAIFAQNVRKWKHEDGGYLFKDGGSKTAGTTKLKKVDFNEWFEQEGNRNRPVNIPAMEQLQDSLVARGFGLPQRLAILATAAQEMDEKGAASKGVGGNGYLGLSEKRMPTSYLNDTEKGRGKQIHYLLEDLLTTHSDNWLDGGSGGPTIMSGQDGFNQFWESPNVYEATRILNKSYIRPAGKLDSWNNRAGVAKAMQRHMKATGGNLFPIGGDTTQPQTFLYDPQGVLVTPETEVLPEYNNGNIGRGYPIAFTPKRPTYVQMDTVRESTRVPTQITPKEEVTRPFDLQLLGASDAEAKKLIAQEVERQKKTLSYDQVVALQTMLKDQKYDLGKWGVNKDGIDGKFGRDTARALTEYYEKQRKDELAKIDLQERYKNAVSQYNGISYPEKAASMLTTTLPSHVGAFTNKVQEAIAGKLLNIDNVDAAIGDLNQQADERVRKAEQAVRLNPTLKNKNALNKAREERESVKKKLYLKIN